MVVVSGTRFENFFFFFARTATHVRACESEGTACVVVLSGTRFESFFFACLHVWPCTYGHVRTKERPVWLLFLARGLKFFCFVLFARTAMHLRACTSLSIIPAISVCLSVCLSVCMCVCDRRFLTTPGPI